MGRISLPTIRTHVENRSRESLEIVATLLAAADSAAVAGAMSLNFDHPGSSDRTATAARTAAAANGFTNGTGSASAERLRDQRR